MRHGITILAALLCSSALAQQPDFDVLLQGDRDMAKLLWLPNNWPAGVDGFNVRRRAAGGEWQTLNSAPINPTVYEADLATRTNDPAVLERLRASRTALLAKKRIREMPLEQMRSEFLEDKTGIKMTKFMVAQSFDAALIQGFAYLDAKVPKAVDYEYALFTVSGGQEAATPVATRTWKWGARPALTLEFSQPEAAGWARGKGLTINWRVSSAEVESKQVREFRIMKQTKQGVVELQRSQVNHAEGNPTIGFFDMEYPHSERAVFYVEPVDIFDHVGTASPKYELDVSKNPLP